MSTSPSSSPPPAKNSGLKAQSTKPTLTPLQQALQQQQQAADQAAAQTLRQHEARLSEAMTAALNTFQSDISKRKKWLLVNLIGWPILALSLCTALAVGGVWAYWNQLSPWETKTMQDGKKQVLILKADWFKCLPDDPKDKRMCKYKE